MKKTFFRQKISDFDIFTLQNVNIFDILDIVEKFHPYLRFCSEKIFFHTKKQIMTKIFFEPIHKSKFYKNSKNLKLINTNDISSRIISLPMYPQLTKNEMNYICNSIEEFLERESCY